MLRGVLMMQTSFLPVCTYFVLMTWSLASLTLQFWTELKTDSQSRKLRPVRYMAGKHLDISAGLNSLYSQYQWSWSPVCRTRGYSLRTELQGSSISVNWPNSSSQKNGDVPDWLQQIYKILPFAIYILSLGFKTFVIFSNLYTVAGIQNDCYLLQSIYCRWDSKRLL